MNYKLLGFFTVLLAMGLESGFAQTQTSTGEKEFQEEKTMKDETLGFVPQVGVLAFTNQRGEKDGRQLAGLGINFNFASLAEEESNMRDYYLGFATGAFYSHMGEPSGNFFGEDATVYQGMGGANLLLIPMNAKVGYNFTPSFRGSVRGGGNVIYRSIASSTNLGDGSESGQSLWSMYPNVGADFELQVGRSVSLIARPDLTIAPNNNLFMGTVGATIIMSL